jgi:acetyl/propionyl-CoA carboxylase alpha subunit
MGRYFEKVFIPNRGVIAVRAIRTLRDLGIRAVVGFSDCDRTSLAVRMADEAFRLGPAPSSVSYLDPGRVVRAAAEADCDGLFPGYGFLAESADLADACSHAGLTFIGPPAEVLRLLAKKDSARRTLAEAGFTVLPGTGAAASAEDVRAFGERVGFPLLLKPVAGSGGLGTVRVDAPGEIPARLEHARSLSSIAFGDDAVCVEKLLDRAASISIQFVVDRQGNAIHLGEREGSIQRHYGKLVDEAPSPKLGPGTRARFGARVASAMARLGYVTAGTVEFLLTSTGEMIAIEVNPRIQVEHVVTEMVSNVDIIEQMIRTAAGEPLALRQQDIHILGHAVQCRIKAEDPAADFRPSAGRITQLQVPTAPFVRCDAGVCQGCDVPLYYDALLMKICAVDEDRPKAIRRLASALTELQIGGVTTTAELQHRILGHRAFVDGTYDTSFLERYLPELLAPSDSARATESPVPPAPPAGFQAPGRNSQIH